MAAEKPYEPACGHYHAHEPHAHIVRYVEAPGVLEPVMVHCRGVGGVLPAEKPDEERFKITDLQGTVTTTDGGGTRQSTLHFEGDAELVITYVDGEEIPIPELTAINGYYVTPGQMRAHIETTNLRWVTRL